MAAFGGSKIEIIRVDKSQEATYLEQIQNLGFEHIGEPMQIEFDKDLNEIRTYIQNYVLQLNANSVTEVINPAPGPGQNATIVYYIWRAPQAQAEPQPFACPYCTRPFMAVPGSQAQVVACPTCGGANIIPAMEQPVISAPPAPTPPPGMEEPIIPSAPPAAIEEPSISPPTPEPTPAPAPAPSAPPAPPAQTQSPAAVSQPPVPAVPSAPTTAPAAPAAPTATAQSVQPIAETASAAPAAQVPAAQAPAAPAARAAPARSATATTAPAAASAAQPARPSPATPATTAQESTAPAPMNTPKPQTSEQNTGYNPTTETEYSQNDQSQYSDSYQDSSPDYTDYYSSENLPSFDYFTKKVETVQAKPQAPLIPQEYETSYNQQFTSTEQAVKTNMQKLANLLANPKHQIKFYDSGELMYPKVTIRKSAYTHLGTREMDLIMIKDGVNDYKIIANETHGAVGGSLMPMQDELFAIKTLGHASYRAMEDWAYLDESQKSAISKCIFAFSEIYYKKLPKEEPEEGR